MLFTRPTDEVLYDALTARDPAYDGFAYVCVTSTRIFCRLTCPARKPKRENCIFQDNIAACLEAGFRPCKRCRPLLKYKDQDPTVSALLDALEKEPARRWREDDLRAAGYDLSTVRRAFKRQFGMSFLEMARLRRVGQAAEMLAEGGRVIDAQIDAGFESGSGFRAAINALVGEAPAGLRGQTLLKADWLETPLGPMMAIVDDHALHLLEFADRPALPNEIRRLKESSRMAIASGRTPVTDMLAAVLDRYFSGESSEFGVRIAGHGTGFERDVWTALQAIPVGETMSYSELARKMGRESAVRAVARANGANQIAILIPCHRVLGADGSLTGYGGGLWRKRWLIEHERRMAANRESSVAG